MVSTRSSKKGKEKETKDKQMNEAVPSKSNKRTFDIANEESDPVNKKNINFSAADEKSDHANKKYKGKEKSDISLDMDMDNSIENVSLESDEEDDDDSIDWETIQLPPRFDDQVDKVTYDDVEIVMEAPRPILK